MLRKITTIIVMSVLLLIIHGGCESDMNLQNNNNPDTKRMLVNSDDIEDLIGGSFLTYWHGWMTGGHGARMRSFLGDNLTTSWCGEVIELLREPRVPWTNPAAGLSTFNGTPWKYTYEAITSVNDALNAIDTGYYVIEKEMRARAFAKFIQGLGHGALGMFFDKGYILDQNFDLDAQVPEPVPWLSLINSGIGYLEECIVLCDNSFTTPANWVNGFPMTNTYLKQLCHSLIARYLAASPRTPAGRASVDWNLVISHLDQGIQEDFAPEGDDDAWYNAVMWSANRGGWDKVSNKLHGPSDTSGNYEAWLAAPLNQRYEFDNHSLDRRVTGAENDPQSNGLYIAYDPGQFFRASRGTQFFSNYKWIKHSYHYPQSLGPMPYVNIPEMDMLRAEALLRTGGSRVEVAQLINKTRVGIGDMPPITGSEPDLDIWKALCYEKRIETIGSTPSISWWDYRGWSDFEFLNIPSGTAVHFPIPGRELTLLGLDHYNTGGVGNPDTTPSVKANIIDIDYLNSVRKLQESRRLDNFRHEKRH